MRSRILVGLLLTVIAAASAVAAPPLPVRIGYGALRINLPLYVAQQKGFFGKHGLAVTLKRFDTAQPCMDALVAGRIALSGYAAFPISFAAQERSQVPIRYATLLLEDARHPFSYLIVPRASKLRRLSDLADKRVGILPTVAYRSWFGAILKAAGVSGVVIQNVAPALQAPAIASGQVDALFTNDPMATAILHSGKGRMLVTDALCPRYIRNPFPFGSFNMRDDWVRAHPEAARRVVAALDDAIRFIDAHQRAAKLAMAPYVAPEQRAFVADYPDSRYLTSRQTRPADLADVSRLYARLGILPRPLELTGLVYR